MTKKSITTDQAPQAIGAYSQAVISNNMLYVSGQIPLEPSGMEIVDQSFDAAADQVLNNLEAICKAANCSLDNIVKLTIYLTDLNNFNALNAIMEKRFTKPFPARATIEVSALPKGVTVEMDAIVEIP
ncbi:MAG: RidA family protein [Pseudomonadota bacterium]|nr:RidA family protein [Pseudomonadota bacterium]|tara:strand:- start:1863 stop:2246 length:384 start_codon:yes stop_codon:yes gene_type:complete